MDPISNRDPQFMREMADMETGWDELRKADGLEKEPYLTNYRRYEVMECTPAFALDAYDFDE